MFELNTKVVYPGHGVALVESLIEKKVSGTTITFFKLSFLYKDMTILLPTHNLDSTGVRFLSDEKMVKKAMKALLIEPGKEIEQLDLSPSGWNKRNKEYQSRIQSGKLLDIVSIYRDLMHISVQKELSFGEKSLLHATEELLVQEIIEVQAKERTSVLQELREPFKRLFVGSKSGLSQKTPTL